jgi:hypothetical protein
MGFTMIAPRHRIQRLVMAGLAAATLAVALPSATAAASPPNCVNGVIPLNPYVVNCNLPPRGKHVIGAAPDAGAIIACRHVPMCISYYVNYPGTLLVPGYPSYGP